MQKLRIIVTGGLTGLGREIVARLQDAGHRVYAFDLKKGDDVRSPDLHYAKQGLGGVVDGIINCAGINCNEWFEEVSPFSLQNVMETNAFSFVYMTQACLEELKRSKGFVLNIVSNAAHIPMTSSLAYNMSKAAGLMATKQMAHELTPRHGITVLSVSPNKLAGTEMSKEIEANVCKVRGWTPEFAAEYQKKALMHGRETDPKALADFIGNIIETRQIYFMSGTDIPFGK